MILGYSNVRDPLLYHAIVGDVSEIMVTLADGRRVILTQGDEPHILIVADPQDRYNVEIVLLPDWDLESQTETRE